MSLIIETTYQSIYIITRAISQQSLKQPFKIFLFIFRYSDSPTSELEGRTPKGRGKRSRGGGTPVETETRKNLRSSKVNTKGRGGNLSQANSPAKRKGRPGEGGDEKRARTDSSRNSPGKDHS